MTKIYWVNIIRHLTMSDNSVIQELLSNLRNKRSLIKSISQDMLAAVRRNFEEEGRPRWTPLSKRTIRERTRLRYWPGKILVRSGQLLRSIQAQATEDTAIVSTNKPYAALHNYGGTVNLGARTSTTAMKRSKSGKWKKSKGNTGQGYTYKAVSIVVPKREFMVLTDQDRERINERIKNFLLNKR